MHAGYVRDVVEQQEATWERPTREVETLDLFPLKSYVDLEAAEKVGRYVRGSAASEQCREFSFFDVSAGGRDPPLELRLCSFGPRSAIGACMHARTGCMLRGCDCGLVARIIV